MPNTIKLEITLHEADMIVEGLTALQIQSAELAQKIREQAMPQMMPAESAPEMGAEIDVDVTPTEIPPII